jgi:hypothetical protein
MSTPDAKPITINLTEATPTACSGGGGGTPNASSFCGAEECISHGICDALHPAVTFDPVGSIGTVWHDRRDGNFEIYMRLMASRIDPTNLTLANNYAFDPVTRRLINMSCSGMSLGGSSNSSSTTGVLIRQSGGRLDVNATSRVMVLTATQGSIDFASLKVTPGASVRIENGLNAGQTYTVAKINAPTVLELLYVSTAKPDTSGFLYSITAASTGLSSPEVRLTCDPYGSMFPDIVSDSGGRYHIVYQDNQTGTFELYYIQVYPNNLGKAECKGGSAPLNVLGFSPAAVGDANSIVVPTATPGVTVAYPPTGTDGSFFSFGNKSLPDPLPNPNGPINSRTGLHKIFKDSTTKKCTGVSLAADRATWDQQAVSLPAQVRTPPYIATLGNPIADPGDFGTNDFGAAFRQVAFIAQTPPDMGVEIRRICLPLKPACVPDMPANVADMTPSLVESPKKPLPPTFVDPIDLSGILTSPLATTDTMPPRFTVDGDNSGTVFTNILVDDGRGQLNRLVFDCSGAKNPQDQLAFMLGQRKCGQELCGVTAGAKSPALMSSQYKIRLEVWQGSDYRGVSGMPATMTSLVKLMEREFTFNPGSNITAFDFKEKELIASSGRYLFFVPVALDTVQFYVEGTGNGHAVWTTNGVEGDQNRFDQYITPYTIPPNLGLNVPVYYEGILRIEPPVISSALKVGGSIGEAFTYQITAANGPTNFDASDLPDGLTVDTATGLISGTPTTNGAYDASVFAENSAGRGSAVLEITISNAPRITSPLTANGKRTKAFTYTITATHSPTGYGAVGLPDGLTVDPNTGVISGTPTANAVSSVEISATNGDGIGTAILVITIADLDAGDRCGIFNYGSAPLSSFSIGQAINIYADSASTTPVTTGTVISVSPIWMELTSDNTPNRPTIQLADPSKIVFGSGDPTVGNFYWILPPNNVSIPLNGSTWIATPPSARLQGKIVPCPSTGSVNTPAVSTPLPTGSTQTGSTQTGSTQTGSTQTGDTGVTTTVIPGTSTTYTATVPLRITNSKGNSVHPRLAIDSKDLIWLVFHSDRTGTDEVYVGRYFCGKWATSAVGGADFKLTTAGETGHYARFANVAVDDISNAHVVWHSNDTEDNLPEIFYSQTSGDAKTFSAPRKLTASPTQAMMPDIVVTKSGQGQGGAKAGTCPTADLNQTAPQQSEGKVFVAWHDNRFGQYEILAATKEKGVWESSGEGRADTRITQASGDSLYPRLAADSKGNARVVYHDYRRGLDNPWIFMSTFVASINRWDATGQGGTDIPVSATGTLHSLHPDIAIDLTDGVYVVWHDDRNNSSETESGYQILGSYCAKGGAPLAICVPICTNTEAFLQTDFTIVDPINNDPIDATNIPDVNLSVTAAGAMYYRIMQDDGDPSAWLPFRSGADLDTMVIPYTLTGGVGMKKVCVQVQDSSTVGFPVCKTIMLQAGIPSFRIEFFKDAALTVPLDQYKDIPVSPEGDVYVRLTSAAPLIYPPTFDVLSRGIRMVYNQRTMAVSGFSGAAGTIGGVVSEGSSQAFSAYAGTVFTGRMHVYRDDGFFHQDGPARLVPHGRDVFGQVF